MRHTQHISNNGVLGAPARWDQGELPCGALPITRTEHCGQPVIASYWRPTPEELVLLNAGAPVALWVIGQTMPPVSLGVDRDA
jgi:hypothetical protein